jgi:hypothetical protein
MDSKSNEVATSLRGRARDESREDGAVDGLAKVKEAE